MHLEDIMLRWISQSQEDKHHRIHSHEVSTVIKFIETKSRMVITTDCWEGGKGALFNAYRFSFVRCISQGSPERERERQKETDRERFIRRHWLHNYGGWEVTWPVICKPQAQESWWCSSSPREGVSQCSPEADHRKGTSPPFSDFCSLQALSRLDDTHAHWGGQSTLLNPPV